MTRTKKPELLFLHPLPLDGSMWAGQMDLLPGASHAPTLYGLGDTVEEWATSVLKVVDGDRLIVVGCSVGGSCAIELAIAAPERVAALVLTGTKADLRPDPELHAAALQMLREQGVEKAWQTYWAPLFSPSADAGVVAAAKTIALGQSAEAITRGVTAFHTRPSRSGLLPTVRCPVIVVVGADDVAPGPKISAAQAHSAPQGRLHVIPDCGHYVPLERPERLNAILRGVIADQVR
ncbi:alpha/beta hydrolase [Thalassobaculum sp.]|uniref:alpha/beta fold hydrolase n=1 Tax=Thalassobaculum sp. TaxID=2022740 RepID=UPI0032ED6AEB